VLDEYEHRALASRAGASDEHQHPKKLLCGGYQPQGSLEIAAPEALRSVAAKPKRRKNRLPSFCRLRRQTAPVAEVNRRSNRRKGKLASDNQLQHDPQAA